MNDLSMIDTESAVNACDGQGVKRLAHAALLWLEANYEHVNTLNVFPVPDGDTGTNMLLTMRSAYGEVSDSDEASVGKIAAKLAKGAMLGSRGNSGVILSQLWRGFARTFEGLDVLTTESLIAGLQEASRLAYGAVQTPVEGTMLTVSRDIAGKAQNAETDDIRELLQVVVDECYASVKRTPDLLPVLKQAGVVDSGGMGMTYLFEGMLHYLKGKNLETATVRLPATIWDEHEDEGEPEYDPDYPYDVQFLIQGEGLDVDRIRRDIEAMGDSGVIVGGDDLVKVHIHVANPGQPIGYGAEVGELLDVVVENMYLQYIEFIKDRDGEPEPIEKPQIEAGTIATVVIAPGSGFERIFYSLGAAHVIAGGQTMNPSTKDILDACHEVPTDKIIVLPNNKNIFMAAQQAAESANGKHISVVESRTVPQGISAQLALNPHGALDEVCESMHEMIGMVETGEVTVAVRDANVDGVSVTEGQIIGLHNGKMRIAGETVPEVVGELLAEMEAEDLELITLYYGADVSARDAEALAEHLRETYPDHEIEIQEGGQAHYFYIISAE